MDQAIDFLTFAENKILVDKWSPDATYGYAKLHQLFEGSIVCSKTLYHYIEQSYLNVRNIDLPMKTRWNTKKHCSRQNKRVLGCSIMKEYLKQADVNYELKEKEFVKAIFIIMKISKASFAFPTLINFYFIGALYFDRFSNATYQIRRNQFIVIIEHVYNETHEQVAH